MIPVVLRPRGAGAGPVRGAGAIDTGAAAGGSSGTSRWKPGEGANASAGRSNPSTASGGGTRRADEDERGGQRPADPPRHAARPRVRASRARLLERLGGRLLHQVGVLAEAARELRVGHGGQVDPHVRERGENGGPGGERAGPGVGRRVRVSLLENERRRLEGLVREERGLHRHGRREEVRDVERLLSLRPSPPGSPSAGAAPRATASNAFVSSSMSSRSLTRASSSRSTSGARSAHAALYFSLPSVRRTTIARSPAAAAPPAAAAEPPPGAGASDASAAAKSSTEREARRLMSRA